MSERSLTSLQLVIIVLFLLPLLSRIAVVLQSPAGAGPGLGSDVQRDRLQADAPFESPAAGLGGSAGSGARDVLFAELSPAGGGAIAQAPDGANQTPQADLPLQASDNPLLPPDPSSPDPRTEATAMPTAVAAALPTPTPAPAAKSAAPSTSRDYTIQPGDQLVVIADRYGVSIDAILSANGLRDADHIQIGQVLHIPQFTPTIPMQPVRDGALMTAAETAPADRLVPDSEAVYSPAYAGFDVNAFAQPFHGYLSAYVESVDGMTLSGPQIVQLIAERFSVGPRVLLTLLEMHGGWVTAHAPGQVGNPFGLGGPGAGGLYNYLFYAASFLNEGYYAKATGVRNVIELHDGRRVMLAPNVNPGTGAVQDAIGHEVSHDTWLSLIGANGFRATYQRLFGDPAQFAIEPLVPGDLKQPPMRLPFEDGVRWFFTGGPHAGWADGSARAALDFAPPDGGMSCAPSQMWALAAAPGRVVASEHGRVMVNVAGGTFQGSGWTVLYMHMASQDRVQVGAMLKMGDRVGHPSCEGGASTASHLHFARLYNGQWIAASDLQSPLNLSGWVAKDLPKEYEGFLVRNGEARMADAVHGKGVNAIYGEGPAPDSK